jgi:hypothetical protein
MQILIVYESMYGNTHAIGAEIAAGLAAHGEAKVVAVHEATPDALAWAEAVIVGGPTHAHGMSSAQSRKGALEAAETPDSVLTLDPDAAGPGLRDWFKSLGAADGKRAAAFDTRVDAPAVLTGRASRGIARRLRDHGFHLVVDPESFLVDKHNELVAGEAERARAWGVQLGKALTAAL